MKIIKNTVKPITYGFDISSSPLDSGLPEGLIGRNICALSTSEKQNHLIQKLLECIRKPSTKEFNEIKKDFMVRVFEDKVQLVSENNQEAIYNVGTIETPAFFYDKFIFVLNRKKKAFVPVNLNVIYFNENYVLMMIAKDLLVKFDTNGLKCLGNFVSVTKVKRGYIIVVKNTYGNEVIYAASQNIQRLFETNEESIYKIDSPTGLILHEYLDLQMIPAEKRVDVYVSTAKGYGRAMHDII